MGTELNENPNRCWAEKEEGTLEYMKIIQSIMGGRDNVEREKNKKNIKFNLADPLLLENDTKRLKEV